MQVNAQEPAALAGKRILVVEDDYFLADDICEDLRKQGAIVLGPAPTSFYAECLMGRRGVDLAVLDVRLNNSSVYPLADELVSRGTPVIFATGQDQQDAPVRFRSMAWLNKPLDMRKLVSMVHEFVESPVEAPVLEVLSPVQMPRSTGEVRATIMRTLARTLRRP